MKTNLWYQINVFLFYLEKKLGANKHLFRYKRIWGQINDSGWGGGGGGGGSEGHGL